MKADGLYANVATLDLKVFFSINRVVKNTLSKIANLNQFQFAFTIPLLQLLLTVDGSVHCGAMLVPNQKRKNKHNREVG